MHTLLHVAYALGPRHANLQLLSCNAHREEACQLKQAARLRVPY